MGEALDLAPDRLIRSFPHARRTVRRAAGHRDQDVRLRPSAFGEHFAELLEIDLELVGPIGQRGPLVRNAGIGFFAEPDEIGPRAIETILHDVEL
jgi:hypothetical protein